MPAALGQDWTIVLAQDGALHACGHGEYGQLGLNTREHQLQPARVGGAELHDGAPVVLVAAGEYHWAAVLADGAVLTCGRGHCGQLGHGDAQDRLQPALLVLPVFGSARVVFVACGRFHTLAVTGGGRVFSCGGNSYGQLGHGDTIGRQVFALVNAGLLGGCRIVLAAAGDGHSVAATAEGDVFSWGDGTDCCLGHNDEEDRLAPTQLGRGQFGGGRVVLMAAGVLHTVALTEGGVLWVWGRGSGGQLGLGDTNNRLVPTRLGAGEVFGGSLVRVAACGGFHTLAVTTNGVVWAWGEGRFGRLGLNDEQDRLTPTCVDPECFAGRVATVAAGAWHSAAVTEGGAPPGAAAMGQRMMKFRRPPPAWVTPTCATGSCPRPCRRATLAAPASGGGTGWRKSTPWPLRWAHTRGWGRGAEAGGGRGGCRARRRRGWRRAGGARTRRWRGSW